MHRYIFTTVVFLLLGGCGSTCENEISQTVFSPSAKRYAVVFNRGCGATVGFNTQVSILPAGIAVPDESGNVLIVDGSIPLKIEWESDEMMQITGNIDTQIFKQEMSISGVRVAYTGAVLGAAR
jgi:hypothetical protein